MDFTLSSSAFSRPFLLSSLFSPLDECYFSLHGSLNEHPGDLENDFS